MSLYRNIHAKRKRIKAGSGEKMRKKGEKGAPTKLEQEKNQKALVDVYTLMKTLKIQLELNLLLQQMLKRQSQKLKKLINRMQEKSKS